MLPFFSCGRRNLPDGGYSMKKMLTIGLVIDALRRRFRAAPI